ncbi:MAG: alpha/beta hydrolase-fold protein [Verrucomicrobiota bacterium]
MSDTPSYFRTTEIGEIPFPSGTLKQVTVKSPALSARADCSVYVPQQCEGLQSVPVVILLHGVYGSHWVWMLMGKAHLTLQRLIDAGEIPPMILATPSDGLFGDGSAYLEHHGKNYEKWIVEDVPQLVHEVTVNALEASHFIGGLSMGGYGALRLGACYPDRFAAFAGHSSITDMNGLISFIEEPLEAYEQSDLAACSIIAAMMKNQDRLSPFRFDCGVDDELIEDNRKLHEQLVAAGIDHTYEEFSRGHEWPYWEEHVEKTYRFFAEHV